MKKYFAIGLAVTVLAFGGLIGYGQSLKAQDTGSISLLTELVKAVTPDNSDFALKALSLVMPQDNLGGTVYNRVIDFIAGFTVDGNTIFNSSAVATFPSSLTVSGKSTFETLEYGGGTTATSTSVSTGVLLATAFDVEDSIDITPTKVSTTFTLPVTSTVTTFLDTVGDKGTLWITNGTGTAQILVTISAGTGWNFNTSSSSATVLMNARDKARLDCRRLARGSGADAGNIDCLVTLFNDL